MADKNSSIKSCPYAPSDPVEALPLIGPKYAEKLERLEIQTVKDLLYHFPIRYKDTRDIDDIATLKQKGDGTILGRIESIQNTRIRNGRWLTKAQVSDHSGQIEIVWFNQPYLAKSMSTGQTFLFNGKVSSKWGGPSLVNPQYEKTLPEKQATTHLGKLTPRYPETAGVSSKWLRARIKPLKKFIPHIISDYIPKDLADKFELIDLASAVQNLHFPDDVESIEKAQHRLGLDELISIQIKIRKLNKKRNKFEALSIDKQSQMINKLHTSLSYNLTDCQQDAVVEILEDMQSDTPMYRLLNGDVGSGKTIVALTGALNACAAGYTSVIMAPTTILAKQHYQNIKNILQKAGIDTPVNLITSNEKQEISNESQIIVGTHALLYKDHLPINTAFLVVDEQHRFGVNQRNELQKLASKSQSGKTIRPHYLTMTATPIPRSLTLALYGETNVSILDKLPPGRKKTKTYLVPDKKRHDSYEWIKKHLDNGEQLFVICPLVEESEKVDAKSAENEYERLKSEVFSNKTLALVHGQMKDAEKDKVLEDFRQKKYSILVATPVVEVGIDIPNATMMIIENAERFGLAQLHQFRGRIGRDNQQAYCFLFTGSEEEGVYKRLEFFSKTNSGFKVAEYDLKRRGPGEVYGTKQSGLLQLHFADLSDNKMIKTAGEIADKLIS